MAEPKSSQSGSLKPLPLSELFLWGRVRRPHGLKGHLLAESFAENPTAYDRRYFWVVLPGSQEGMPYRVATLRPYAWSSTSKAPNRLWRLRFAGDTHRTQAEIWKGAELWLPRRYLPPLEGDAFYYIEALGAQVVDSCGNLRGYLKAIQPGPAYDFFIVENEARASFWIPAPFVRRLRRESTPPCLEVEAPEDLWDPTLAQGRP
ncbi:MAG: hypothetical protein ABDH91_06765 [Bacteroidia bacterium]